MTAGAEAAPGGAVNRNPEAPPSDTGEALGLPASALTLTFGVGAGLFDDGSALGRPRNDRRAWPTLPRVHRSTSSTPRSPAATSASRRARTTRRSRCTPCATWCGWVSAPPSVRWSQLGFGRTSSTSTTQATPRNLFGFKDGTNNLKAEDPAALDQHVWVRPGDGPAWLDGGTLPGGAPDPHAHRDLGPHLARRAGDRSSAGRRARARRSGRPTEFEPADFTTAGSDGKPAIGDGRAHPARLGRVAGWRADPAARLQLRRRHRRPGPPERRAVLRGLHARPARPVRADAAGAGQRTT